MRATNAMHASRTIRPIRTDADHRAALARIEELMAVVGETSEASSDADELEVLATLVEAYEAARFPVAPPNPVEAIRFRMEQAGLRQKDLVPFIGAPSRVSEVLSGSRPLTVEMIRRLYEGLGIPLRSLVGTAVGAEAGTEAGAEVRRAGVTAARTAHSRRKHDGPTRSEDFLKLVEVAPVGEMAKRGWFDGFRGTPALARKRASELLERFLGSAPVQAPPRLLRRSPRARQSRTADAAITLWHRQAVRVADRARLGPFEPAALSPDFARRLATLSDLEHGPVLAAELLARHGVALVALAHLPRTHVDGAATRRTDGHPVVALSLRHGRLDHFWFTLLHELGHVALHLGDSGSAPIVDEFADAPATAAASSRSRPPAPTERREREADDFARNALIPEALWRSAVRASRTNQGLLSLRGDASTQRVHAIAREAGVHPSIVAGRVRRESGDFRRLSALVAARLPAEIRNAAGEGWAWGLARG
jgi:HTH-type transcriptional regulator/antitoxin HigA